MKQDAESIYDRWIKPLTDEQRLRLVEKIIHELVAATGASVAPAGHDWMSVRGIAPGLLDGNDAQQWVSRSRQEADAGREPKSEREK